MKPNLLIVDDEEHTREGLELALEDKLRSFSPRVRKRL
jgi:YesN/AraC family two-component response regulator